MAQQRLLLVSDENFIRFIQCALSEVKVAVKLKKKFTNSCLCEYQSVVRCNRIRILKPHQE